MVSDVVLGFGLVTMLQLLPFQRSIRVRWLSVEVPHAETQ